MPNSRKYYADENVTLYFGDMREIVPQLDSVDVVVTDPPYGETRLGWDYWPDGWPAVVALAARSMWCFGSTRMFLQNGAQFTGMAGWKFSQDVVWEKHNGSGFAADRFRRVHEHATHWYRGAWADIHHQVPIVDHDGPYRGTRRAARAGSAHLGTNNGHNQPWIDNGTRLMRSVIYAPSMKGRAIHPTEKPVEILRPLIEYACPLGGTVLDPFAGSGSTAVAAVAAGRRAVLVEADEQYCKAIANRLSQGAFDLAATVTRPNPSQGGGAL